MGQQRERQIELSPQHFERFGERIDFCGMREIKESRGFLTRNAQCAGNIGGLNLKRPRPFNKAGLSLRKKWQHGFAFTRMRPLARAGESAVKFAEESSGNTTFQRA